MKTIKNPYLPSSIGVRSPPDSITQELSKAGSKAKAHYSAPVQSVNVSAGGPMAKKTRAYDPTGGLPSGA